MKGWEEVGQPRGWRCLWSKSGSQGSHKRGWERLGAAPQTSCLKATGGPGGRERKKGGRETEHFCTLSGGTVWRCFLSQMSKTTVKKQLCSKHEEKANIASTWI